MICVRQVFSRYQLVHFQVGIESSYLGALNEVRLTLGLSDGLRRGLFRQHAQLQEIGSMHVIDGS